MLQHTAMLQHTTMLFVVFDQCQHMWQEFVCSCVCVCAISRDSGWSCLNSEWLWWNLLETLFLSLLHTRAHSLVYCVLLGCLAIQRWEKIEILWFSSASCLHPSFPPSLPLSSPSCPPVSLPNKLSYRMITIVEAAYKTAIVEMNKHNLHLQTAVM